VYEALTCQLARIFISSVTLEHTPVEAVNVPPHDPDVIVKPLSEYPLLEQLGAVDAVSPQGV